MSTLTLLRHGQAAFGAENYDQLSPLGLEQGLATSEFFRERGQRFDQVWIGPRQRHRRTAEAALSASTHPLAIIDDGLDEFAEGTQILRSIERRSGIATMSDSTMSHAEKLRLYAEEIGGWASGEIVIQGVRSAATFRRDVDDWLIRVMQQQFRGQQVLAVTSAGVVAAIVCTAFKLPDAALADYMRVVHNASLTTLLYSSRGLALQSFNGSAHLPKDLLSLI